MINSKFLAPALNVAGLEFMDFQSHNFFNEMVQELEPCVTDGELYTVPSSLNAVIKKYTGFENIKFNLIDYGNLAIDTGYMSPGNILNSKGIEHFLPKGQSTLYRWFNQNRANFLRGSIDFKTGKVGGAYGTMPLNIYINRYLKEFIGSGKTDIEYVEKIACFLTHELGHAFSGCYGMHRVITDSYAISATIHWMSNAEYGEATVAIIKDAAKIMDIEFKQIKDLEKIAATEDVETVVIALTKLAEQRNQLNTQSLGVDLMNAEVLADVYAVRMGCDKNMIESIREIEGDSCVALQILTTAIVTSLFSWAFFPTMGVLAIGFLLGFFMGTISYLAYTLTSDIYDTTYRRMLNIHQEQLARLKQSKHISDSDKRKLLAELDKGLKQLNDAKPILEDTAVQRAMTWLFSPGTARFDALEHYTKILLNNEMSMVNAKFQLLGKEA